MSLNEDWKPGFGEIITWFAMDRNGLIAVMVNNCFGKLPAVLLAVSDLEEKLDRLNEYMWEESGGCAAYPDNKKGSTSLDLYSSYRFGVSTSRQEVELLVSERSSYNTRLVEYAIPSIKGFYVYHAVEGSVSGEDYPVGYKDSTEMGDYFRFLVPTVKAGIEDFPEELRAAIVISDILDFTSDRVLLGSEVDRDFSRLY